MRSEDVLGQATTPLAGPAFPHGPYRFTDREYLTVVYRTDADADALRRVVPEPLRMVDEPLVRFEVIRMPDVTGPGDYTGSGQLIPVEYEGERGEYSHAMYVDNHPAIAGGRELGAYPKKLGAPGCTWTPTPSAAPSTTARCAWPPRPWATSTGRPGRRCAHSVRPVTGTTGGLRIRRQSPAVRALARSAPSIWAGDRGPGRTAAPSGASRPWHRGALARVGRSALRQAHRRGAVRAGGSDFGSRPYEELAAERDRGEVAVLKALDGLHAPSEVSENRGGSA